MAARALLLVALPLTLASPLAAQDVSSPARAAPAASTIPAGSRLPGGVDASGIRVLTRSDIALLPGRSVLDLLLAVPGLDVNRLGWEGTLGTLSMRGAGAAGTLILVDGEPMNDPGSSLYSADLDLPRDAIERIEILPGDASAIYGPGAIGGVVAITSRGADLGKANAQCETRYAHGVHSLDAYGYRGVVKASRAFAAGMDFTRAESSGYDSNTDFVVEGVRAFSRLSTGPSMFTMSAAYMGRSFGLGAISSGGDARGATRVRTVHMAWNTTLGGWVVDASMFLRAHDGTLDPGVGAAARSASPLVPRTAVAIDTAFTPTLGSSDNHIHVMRLAARREIWSGFLAAGVEGSHQGFASDSTAEVSRYGGAAFLEYGHALGPEPTEDTTTVPGPQPRPPAGTARVALRADWNERFGVHVSPHAELAYRLAEWVRVRASAGTAFRVPTFSEELRARSLTATEVEAERHENVEAGAAFSLGRLTLDVEGFHRWGHDVGDSASEVPAVRARADVTGFEATLELAPRGLLSRLAASVSYADPRDAPELDDLATGEGDLKWSLVAGLAFPFRLHALGRLTYTEPRLSGHGTLLLDARIGWQALQGDIFGVYVEGLNLLDEELVEGGARLPGRVVAAGMNLTW